MIEPILDVDHNRGVIRFDELAGGPVRAMILGVTEGIEDIDPQYRSNVEGCRAIEMPFGNYHFYWPRTGSGDEQFEHFMQTAEFDVGLDALDLEAFGGKTPSQITNDTIRWGTRYNDEFFRKPWLYSNLNGFRNILQAWDEITELFRLWLAYPATWRSDWWIRDGDKPELHQFTWEGVYSGVNPPTDGNRFLGSDNEWAQIVGQEPPGGQGDVQEALASIEIAQGALNHAKDVLENLQ